jgi:cell division protein FtsZ
MSINLKSPDIRELKPRITVFGVGGAGGNAVNNMIAAGLQGVDFVVANTDAQALTTSRAERIIQMGVQATEGLGAGSQPDVGCTAAQEVLDEIRDHLAGAHMVFVTAGMGGGTGTGASPVVAKVAHDLGILTVGVVTKPFHFEGQRRMRLAEEGIKELQKSVDTLIIIPNQNLFRVANEKTTFADAFAMADQVLYSGVACITDLMVKEGLINLDFADVRTVMREMGKAMMGTGEASGEKRALRSAEAAICNPLIDDVSMRGARGVLISITGGKDLTLYEVDEAATRIREEVDPDANIIVGATFDESLDGIIRVSVVATGVDVMAAGSTSGPTQGAAQAMPGPRSPSQPAANGPHHESRIAELAQRLKADNARIADRSGPQVLRPAATSTPAQPLLRPTLDQAATAAVAAALADGDGVSIRPMPPKPGFVEPADNTAPATEAAVPKAFIPPQPERPMSRTTARMPTFEELPLPGQAQYRSRHGGALDTEHPEKRRMTLLQRLAAVGLGRRDDEFDARADVRHADHMPLAGAPLRGPGGRTEPRSPAAADVVKRGAPPVDVRGRPLPLPPQPEDDQLDIPAFLRRQANL